MRSIFSLPIFQKDGIHGPTLFTCTRSNLAWNVSISFSNSCNEKKMRKNIMPTIWTEYHIISDNLKKAPCDRVYYVTTNLSNFATYISRISL